MRDVREQGSERDHHLDTELAGKVDDHVGEGLPAEVRLDPEEQYGVAIEIRDRRVVEGIFRPVDVPRLTVDEGDVRAGRLEVEEVLRLDVGEAVRIPDLGEVAARERGALAAVVPTAKSSDQNRSRMRSSSAIGEVYVRPEEQRREGNRADPDRGRQEDVCEHEPPREMRSPLQLSEPHLGEQQDEHAGTELEEARSAVAACREVAEAEQERQQEDPHEHRMHVDE
jgi:hypothetical protein